MKKSLKKIALHRESLRSLDDLSTAIGGAPVRTVDITGCVTNCLACSYTCPWACG